MGGGGEGCKMKNLLWGEYGKCKMANDENFNKCQSNTGKITKDSGR